jgi:hypothetical protein
MNRRPSHWASVAALALAWVLSATGTAQAAAPATIIGPDLKPRAVTLQGLGGERVSFFDSDRTLQVEPIGGVLRILFDHSAAAKEEEAKPAGGPADAAAGKDAAKQGQDEASINVLSFLRLHRKPEATEVKVVPGSEPPKVITPPPAVLELTDGERFIGQITAEGDGSKLHWQSFALGRLTVDLERIRMLAFDTQVRVTGTPATDRLLLANGDALEGFVVTIEPSGVTFQPAGGRDALKLATGRVHAVHMANPLVRDAKGHVVWLDDGSRVRVQNLSITGDTLTATPLLGGAGATLNIPLERVNRIDLDSLTGRLTDLADVNYDVTEGGQVFGLNMPPRLDGQTLWLHAPVTVRYRLPAGTQRLSAKLALAPVSEAERAYAKWADVDVVLKSEGQTLGRFHLDATRPSMPVNVPLHGGTLTLELDPAANGPVMDRVVVQDAVLFVGAK